MKVTNSGLNLKRETSPALWFTLIGWLGVIGLGIAAYWYVHAVMTGK